MRAAARPNLRGVGLRCSKPIRFSEAEFWVRPNNVPERVKREASSDLTTTFQTTRSERDSQPRALRVATNGSHHDFDLSRYQSLGE